MVISGDYQNLDRFELFVQSETFSEALERFEELRQQCSSNENFTNVELLGELKKSVTNWKGLALLDQLIKKSENAVYFPTRRAAHAIKKGARVARGKNVLIVGAGPCGLRTAIEMAFLGAEVTVIDSRREFSRNNVLHLWPFCIQDLKALGAKSFYGKFCSGAIDHCSIRRLQLLLLKVALLLGVTFHRELYFESILPRVDGSWYARIKQSDQVESPLLTHHAWNCIVDATGGSANTASTISPDLSRKEFRGLLAIGITVNFVNSGTQAEQNVEEISGVASIYKQHFFAQLRNATGIDLENIVYYKDDTHYFVMTARTKSLLSRGVLKSTCDDSSQLLRRSNIDPIALQAYARDAAMFATQYQLPDLHYALNSRGNPDVSIFDFTSRYHSKYAAVVRKTKSASLLGLLVGDALINPFWPTGTGIGKGFLGVFDACWTFRHMCLPEGDVTAALQERELIYKLLDQCDPSTLQKKFGLYTIDPKTRYKQLASIAMQQRTTQILFVEEIKGKRKSLAPMKAQPQKKQNRGSTLNDQEKIIMSWMSTILPYRINKWSEIQFEKGDLLLDLIAAVRPELIDRDTLPSTKMTPKQKTELAINITKTSLSFEPMGSVGDFTKRKPDQLLMLTFLTQLRENLHINTSTTTITTNNLVRAGSDQNANHKSIKKSPKSTKASPSSSNKKSPKKSLEEKLSKLTESLKRRSVHKTVQQKADICPFCDAQVFVAERYGSDGFWFHRKCFKCSTCKQQLVFSSDNYKEIDNAYYCHSCAPVNNALSSTLQRIEEELTEPEKQQIVDSIIEQTNVPKPIPKPRTKFIKKSESLRVYTSPRSSFNSSHGSSNNSALIISDGGSSCDSPIRKMTPLSTRTMSPKSSVSSRSVPLNDTDSSKGRFSGRSGSPPPKLTMDSDLSLSCSSESLSHDSWEEETLSKFDVMDGTQPQSSLPKINYLEQTRNTSSGPNSFIKKSITTNVRDIKLDAKPQSIKRRDTKIQQARVVRPVTWFGPENESIDEDDIHEAEQCVRARQLKAQTVQRGLEEVAVRQIEIEKESVEIEKKIRHGQSNSNELMNAWFELVTEKNQLLRHENKLMIEQRELQLQDHQQSIAATIRERLKLPEDQRTAESKKEDDILERVKKRHFFIRHIERSIV